MRQRGRSPLQASILRIDAGRSSAYPGRQAGERLSDVSSEMVRADREITGRNVRAHVSGIDTEADGVVVVTLILHPPGYDGPPQIDRAAPQRRQRL